MNSKSNTLMVILLIVAAFLVGKFYTEVQYLKSGVQVAQTSPTTQNQPSQNQPAGAAATPAPGAKVTVKVDAGDPVMGKKDAKVTVVEFADYQCPYCGALSGLNTTMVSQMQSQDKTWEPFGTNFIKEYVTTGKAKFIYKDFAFLDNGSDTGESHLAGQAARCSGDQSKYWEMHDWLYSNQNGENKGDFTSDKLKAAAQTLGLDATKFNDCLDTGKYAKTITDNTAYGRTIGVSSTPAVFINGQLLSGAQSYQAFKSLIDQELAK